MHITIKKFSRWFLCGLGLILVFIYIFAESNYIQNKNILFNKASLSDLIVSSLGLALMLWAWPSKSRFKWLRNCAVVLKSGLILTILFMVFSEAAMVDFSGMLFGPEAIVHFSWDAFVLGVNEYLWLFCVLLIFLVLAVFMLVYSSQVWLSNKVQWWVFLSSILLLSSAYDHTVLGRYTKGIKRYLDINQFQDVSEKQLEKLEPLGISKLVVSKSAITASSGNNKNLIVIYLESFSEIFTTSNQYPHLTPNINRLKSEYVSLHPYVSTAKFTMDGLIGSLCGFLPNMTHGNNSLTDSEKHYYFIPCMTDVLKQAGYHQEFLGGAKKSFASKGEFLMDHGYDKVWGWEDFERTDENKRNFRKNWWGLHDDELFDKAFNRIKTLSIQQKPFHISLLTLSTHLKGFPAPSCQPFEGDSDKFINAIHCTDQLVGQFIQKLKLENRLDNTVIFITGDHLVFSTSLTQSLFGPRIKDNHILGIIIDQDQQAKQVPMALYDMAPVLLDRLQIDHNVSFINGQSKPYDSDRLLLTRKQVYKNGTPLKLNTNCDLTDELELHNITACTHRNVINTIHGYTQLFKLNRGLKYNSGSSLSVRYNNEKSLIEEISVNGMSIKSRFTRKGFKLSGDDFSSDDIFFIHIDPEDNKITHTFLLDKLKKPLKSINAYNQALDRPYIVFGVKNAINKDLISQLKQKNQVICFNNQFCSYQIEKIGSLNQNLDQTEVTLNFGLN